MTESDRRLFLDANVLFTAVHNPDGKAAFVIASARKAGWQLLSSAYAVEEARRNLERKFPSGSRRLGDVLAELRIAQQPARRDLPIELPEKDRPIFLAAVDARCTHLLTGDLKHFGPWMNQPTEKTGGILIQTVADFCENIIESCIYHEPK